MAVVKYRFRFLCLGLVRILKQARTHICMFMVAPNPVEDLDSFFSETTGFSKRVNTGEFVETECVEFAVY